MAISVAAALAVIAAPVASAASAAASGRLSESGPDGVTMEIATVNGSGCPLGTAQVALTDSNEAFTVTYSAYTAQFGGDSRPTDDRKNCQLGIRVHVPNGYSYAIASSDYRGYASLQDGVHAVVNAGYYFQGNSGTRHFSQNLPGPYGESWQFTDAVADNQLMWSPCRDQRLFNINTELRLDPGGSDESKLSFISMDSVDSNMTTTYHYAWKRC
jgi:hypothetical protein